MRIASAAPLVVLLPRLPSACLRHLHAQQSLLSSANSDVAQVACAFSVTKVHVVISE